jgi:hypothetical protein
MVVSSFGGTTGQQAPHSLQSVFVSRRCEEAYDIHCRNTIEAAKRAYPVNAFLWMRTDSNESAS